MTKPIRPDDQVRPRQLQIASDIRARILSGDLRPGDRIPSTETLKAEYGIVDKTAQRAIAILKAEGFVEGRPRSGTFVTGKQPVVIRASHYPRPAGSGEPYAWMTDHASQGRAATTELISVGEEPAPAQVAAAFGITTGALVVVRHQLLLLDGEPAELVWNYYGTDLARGTALAEPRKIKGGSPRLLAELGQPLRHAVDQVGARLATVEEFVALKLPEDMPVLRQFRVVYTDSDRPVEATIMIKASQQYEIAYDLPAPPD